MYKLIEELRAQRTLIKKHLDWLDLQIKQSESNHADSSSADTVEKVSVKSFPDGLKDQKFERKFASSNSTEEANIPIEANFTKSTSANDIKRLQIGCFTLFATATLLFLFILFGLPYLLD